MYLQCYHKSKSKIRKRLSFWYLINKDRLKDHLIFVGIVTGIFLPVRLTFYTYVSHQWHTNLGVMTAIAITMFYLVRSGRLGWFGNLFHREMNRITSRKTVKYLVMFSIYDILVFWSILYSIDLGEINEEEMQLMNAFMNPYGLPETNLIIYFDSPNVIPKPDRNSMVYAQTIQPDIITAKLEKFVNDPFMMPIYMGWILHHMNFDMTRGWGSHFASVYLVEQLEGIGLYFFYRHFYALKPRGVSWKKLGIFDHNIKPFIKSNKRQTLNN